MREGGEEGEEVGYDSKGAIEKDSLALSLAGVVSGCPFAGAVRLVLSFPRGRMQTAVPRVHAGSFTRGWKSCAAECAFHPGRERKSETHRIEKRKKKQSEASQAHATPPIIALHCSSLRFLCTHLVPLVLTFALAWVQILSPWGSTRTSLSHSSSA